MLWPEYAWWWGLSEYALVSVHLPVFAEIPHEMWSKTALFRHFLIFQIAYLLNFLTGARPLIVLIRRIHHSIALHSGYGLQHLPPETDHPWWRYTWFSEKSLDFLAQKIAYLLNFFIVLRVLIRMKDEWYHIDDIHSGYTTRPCFACLVIPLRESSLFSDHTLFLHKKRELRPRYQRRYRDWVVNIYDCDHHAIAHRNMSAVTSDTKYVKRYSRWRVTLYFPFFQIAYLLNFFAAGHILHYRSQNTSHSVRHHV